MNQIDRWIREDNDSQWRREKGGYKFEKYLEGKRCDNNTIRWMTLIPTREVLARLNKENQHTLFCQFILDIIFAGKINIHPKDIKY